VNGKANSTNLTDFVPTIMHLARALFVVFALVASDVWASPPATPVKSLLELRQRQVVVQRWDLSCGAAALATLLTYQYDRPVTERQLALQLVQRKEYLADPTLIAERQGFSLLDLKRVAERYGYEGIGLGQLSLKDLIEHAPLIVPIAVHGYNHFVVFRGVMDGQVFIADPAWGNRTLPVETFEHAWIDYPQLGKLGFELASHDHKVRPNQLAPRVSDLVLLR
jgi:predicted double-glycine peptidase